MASLGAMGAFGAAVFVMKRQAKVDRAMALLTVVSEVIAILEPANESSSVEVLEELLEAALKTYVPAQYLSATLPKRVWLLVDRDDISKALRAIRLEEATAEFRWQFVHIAQDALARARIAIIEFVR